MASRDMFDLYGDLADDRFDGDLIEAIGALHVIYTAPELSAETRESLRQTLPERTRSHANRRNRLTPFQRQSRWHQHAPLRIGSIAAAMLTIIILAGGAYAVAPALNRAVGSDPGAASVDNEEAWALNQSQTVDGFTVTLDYAFADPNRVTIGYRVSGPPDRTFNSFVVMKSSLIDGSGTELFSTGGMGSGIEAGEDHGIKWYDATGVVPTDGFLDVSLVIDELRAIEVIASDLPNGAESSPDAQGVEEPGFQFPVVGPFHFKFAVPFEEGIVATLNQTAVADDVALTLERVVVTQTETRIVLHYPRELNLTARLRIGDDEYLADPNVLREPLSEAPGSVTFNFRESLQASERQWVLTVTSDPATATDGPWTFEFVVP